MSNGQVSLALSEYMGMHLNQTKIDQGSMKDSPWQDAKPGTPKNHGVEIGIIIKFFNNISFYSD